MTWIDIAQTIAIFLVFLVAAWSIRYSRQQTKEITKATSAEVYQNVIGSMLQIDQLFIENPELRPYFYDNLEIPKNSELKSKVYGMAEMLIDLLSYVRVQSANMPGYVCSSWIKDTLESSPAVREYLSVHKSWYPELLGWLKSSDVI